MKKKKLRLPHEKCIEACEDTIQQVKEQNQTNKLWSSEEISTFEKRLKKLKKKVYAELQPWDRVGICRHPDRPHTLDYIDNICEEFVEIHGDRTYGDDRAVITGFAKIGKEKFVVIGLEKGSNTEERLERNFGMAHPEGYRKALRAMQMAAKFHLPVITFIDTPGAYPGLTAEERGQGWAIAKNLLEMARLPTPIIVMLIGEGCSGGALGIGIGDVIAMLEHSYYSVISPEGCASILWKDSSKNAQASVALQMHAESLLKMHIIDGIIKEPEGGAHLDPQKMHAKVKKFILDQWQLLKIIPIQDLIKKRYKKFRQMGEYLSLS